MIMIMLAGFWTVFDHHMLQKYHCEDQLFSFVAKCNWKRTSGSLLSCDSLFDYNTRHGNKQAFPKVNVTSNDCRFLGHCCFFYAIT